MLNFDCRINEFFFGNRLWSLILFKRKEWQFRIQSYLIFFFLEFVSRGERKNDNFDTKIIEFFFWETGSEDWFYLKGKNGNFEAKAT